MLYIKSHSIIMMLLLSIICLSCGECDLLLKILQKEMAEEKELFGGIYGYNSKVEDLQEILKEIGYDPGTIDGGLGFRTRSAVKVFQKDYGVKVTGYVDKKTWKVLNRIYEEEFGFDFNFDKINVRQVQSALQKAGFNPGTIDGKLGPRTKREIREFQKSQGLT
ncbi:MAG: peptidoglycan-binding protein [bacterium]|nr:peptidoglycan-binding protein [bacterium]